MYKIAICDDDKRYRKTIREIVEHENSLPENEIRFYEYESGNELLKHTDILHELVFIDIRMPGLDGNQTALKLRNYNKDAVLISIPVILSRQWTVLILGSPSGIL